MILNYCSDLWSSFAPSIGNHLWQSTIFALVTALLTLALRSNRARTRYLLWLSASVKFLLPFSLLVAIGNHLACSQGSAGTKTGVYVAMTNVGQPFAESTTPRYSHAAQLTLTAVFSHFLPAFLTMLWLCGFLVVLCLWFVRWRRISTVVREAVPLLKGREVDTLRRVEQTQDIRMPIAMRLSRASLEPGIFGIIRPVLVWPQAVSGRLEDPHLESILTHELLHIRRRDNLTAAVHMLTAAIFWFYPLVWWIGARLLEERERACDEAVLESGGDRKVYAESILKICEFCVGSPMTCVSGVTGADLKRRIFHIMTEGRTRNLNFTKKLLLVVAGLLALALPIALGLLHPTQSYANSRAQSSPAVTLIYDTVSIKPSAPGDTRFEFLFGPSTFNANNMTLQDLIASIYEVDDAQISEGPSWLTSEKFDVQASMSLATLDKFNALPEPQRTLERKHMLQVLLTDYFHLQFQRQNKELPIYSLVVAENGPKLKQAQPGDRYADGLKSDGIPIGPHTMHFAIGELAVQGLPMTEIAKLLTRQLEHTVHDHTGLTGEYDFTLKWTPDKTQPVERRGSENNLQGPSIFTAVQQQLGLKLEPENAPMEVLLVEHAEKPSEN
jgi:uncharacterized protein (TIGR03435 family)